MNEVDVYQTFIEAEKFGSSTNSVGESNLTPN